MVSDTPPSEITALLRRWNKGDREALSNLAFAAYPDLCAIARGFLRREGSGHTLQATGLVNELYLRLAQVKGVNLTDRRHFYAFAAQLMRMILIDHARQSRALKRPSSATRVPLHEEMAWIDASSEEMLSLDVALDNDAQKTAGIITGVLVASGILKAFEMPKWVIFAAYGAIALGTLSGGWRIVHTMGSRLTRLKPRSGFCAETAAAISILFATEYAHLPVSTTHVTAGAIAGVGSIQRLKAVRWGLATNILWAWILTIPAAALVGWLSMAVIQLFVR
jgi:RNA polymerase sigma factor (TIGR02999 family)